MARSNSEYDGPFRSRLTTAVSAFAGFAVALLLLVPWLWLNPVLAATEFAGVVLSKVGSGPNGTSLLLRNFWSVVGGFGWPVLVCALPGALVLALRSGRAALLPLGVLGAGLVATAGSAQVSDRYGLPFLMPAVLCAATWCAANAQASRRRRIVVILSITVLVALALGQVTASQRRIGRRDAHGLAHDWLMTHLPPGSRVAVHSLYPRHLPRTRAQLVACVAAMESPAAYSRKWATNGYTVQSDAEPMRLAVLNDELYQAHWCRTELAGDTRGGFDVTYYDFQPRFNSRPVGEVVAAFQGDTEPPAYDALLLNRRDLLGTPPTVTFSGEYGGSLYLYLRPGLVRGDHTGSASARPGNSMRVQ